ncbi:MAG TPA: aldehyde dehydrogenase family protein [Armatimonadota bacterium]|nr:aldehyde dehydrogenase family protein [Armatimonadota bacterium]HPP73650.1 aldehyde dehydrogenase family protein [Armatimonadota bacterium]
MKEFGLFINNDWRQTHTTFESINPATEEAIATLASAEIEDVDRAVMAARTAFDSGVWSCMPAGERGRMLRRVADMLRDRAEEFAVAETLDTGKPIFESRNVDIPIAIDSIDYYASLVVDIVGKSIPVSDTALDYTVREPLGVVAAVIPWNFPLVLAFRKLAPALAAGNTVVVKPASVAPLTTMMLGDLFKESGLPDGVVNIITGSGSKVGNALLNHPAVDKLSFTGSTEVGRNVIAASMKNISTCALELGGKSPAVVLPDANLDAAADGILFGAFLNQGECCCAATRVLVDKSIHKDLVARIAERMKGIIVGNGLDEDVRMGPLISAQHREDVINYIEVGKSEAGKPVVGGGIPENQHRGYFVEPTLFDNVPPGSRIYREEIFGPVLTVTPFDGVDKLIEAANDTPYGLAASIWTGDAANGQRLARRIRAGTVWVNVHNFVFNQAPYGGYKQSGIGRELGREGLEAYSEVKNVITWLGQEAFKWY